MAKGKGSRAAEQKRQKWSSKEILDPGFNMPDTYEDLLKVYKTLAKSADQRLVRLEQYSNEENFKTAIKWSYARAQKDIKSWGGADATRFNIKPPKSAAALRARIEDIKTFMKSVTSTKKGIISIYKKKAETFNKNYGTNFTWEELGAFFESSAADALKDEILDSSTMASVIATIKVNGKKTAQQIKDAAKVDIKAPDSMVEDLVHDALEKYGDDLIEAIFGSK